MIQKKREDYRDSVGSGRPFEMNARYPIEKNDEERQKPVIIHLGDLNGQTYEKGMPKNFSKKAGRTLPTFSKYWTKGENDDLFDIE